MLVMILLFFFTNVYVWHDTAVKQANQLYVKQLSSSFKIQQDTTGINITADGGSDIYLSRLWIVDESNPHSPHLYADLSGAHINAGATFFIKFNEELAPQDNKVQADPPYGNELKVHYSIQEGLTCKVVNTLGIEKSVVITGLPA